MKDIKSLLKDTKTVDVPFFLEGMEDFVVTMTYVSKDSLKRLRDESSTQQWDKKSKSLTEDIDLNLFQKLYCDLAIKGWKGLKLKYLMELILMDVPEGMDPEEEVEYSPSNAYDLISNSTIFDSFVSEVMQDLGFFNKASSKKIKKESSSLSKIKASA